MEAVMLTEVPPQKTQELSCPDAYIKLEVTGLGAELTMRQAEGVIKAAMKQMYGVIGTNTAAGYTVLDVRGANDSWNASPASRIIVRLPKGDTQKLGSACAGLTQINDIACTVRLVGVAPTLAQLAVDSRSLAAQILQQAAG